MKIAFVAMSGVRVQDEDLLREGLTLPGFVERSEVIASLPSLGLLTLAGLTPSHHQRSYYEVKEFQNIGFLSNQYDLVVISSFTAQIFEAYDLAMTCRSHGMKVIMGGLHVSVQPHEAMEYCDAICIGEGELQWQNILRDCENDQLQKVYDASEQEFHLCDAPMPAYELLDPQLYNRITVQTSRGCPHSCEFCAGSILLTSKYKQKPAERILAEIDKICELWERPFIEFADDNSFVNKKFWRDLLPEVKKRNIRWFTEADIAVGSDEEFLELLFESGCKELLIGLESPVIAGLEGIELRNNWKLKQIESYKENILRIQQKGIRVNACFIIGLDSHDESIFDAVYDFCDECNVYDVQVTLPTPFPGTALYKRLKKSGRLLEDKAWHKCTLFDLLFEPKNFTKEGLRQGFRELVKRLYSKQFTNKRRQHFNQQWKLAKVD
ncbi:radical SAM protein [Lentisphaera marina]|uniref:B12-binding domain-containing radical SAM protein n=1 Tax=Lentisphaera marina TaxID=1111041 RepID=UPI002365BAE8|nr:radical SAM protein [Lentisphaera marina]MDD7987343.1 radical SAM protein [Lentisphaera marina]